MNAVTAVVVGHEQREKQMIDLVEQLGQWYPTVASMDNGKMGCTGNHIQALEVLSTLQPTSQWVMVMEDDAIPVPDLGSHLCDALHHSPAPIVSLYFGTGRPEFYQPAMRRAVAANTPWIISSRLLHCVAYCIRREHLDHLIDGAYRAHKEAGKPIDEAITEWARRECLPVAYTNPSLVQHADGPVLAIHDWMTARPRVAHNFGTRNTWKGGMAII